MRIGQLVFIFLTFGILKFMIITTYGTSLTGYTQPAFNIPSTPTVTICNQNDDDSLGNPVDCSTFCDGRSCDVTILGTGDRCSYTGCSIVNATIDIGLFIYVIILFTLRLIAFIFGILAIISVMLVSTIPNAPWYINIIMLTPLIIMFGIMVYRLFRKGDDSA